MKSINSRMLMMAFVVFFGLSLNAQSDQKATSKGHRMEKHDKKSPEERAKMMTEKMTKKLNLNEQQSSKIYILTLNESKEREEKMSKNKEARQLKQEARDKEMQSILTPEQYKEFQKMKEDRKGHRKGYRKFKNDDLDKE